MSGAAPHHPRRMPPPRQGRPTFVNLCGDYRFLRGGYWALVDAELNSVPSAPTPLQAITAQNAAATLLVARQAGIPTASWRVAQSGAVRPPCVLVPNAGQTDSYYYVRAQRLAQSQWRSATQNGTRPALEVALEGTLRSFKIILGLTSSAHTDMAWQVWSVFGIPLATCWYLDTDDGPRLVGLDPLPLHELTERELRMYAEVSKRPMSLS